MKHKIRNSIIFLIHVLGISALYRMYFKMKGPLVRVIAFHDVADGKWFNDVIGMLNDQFHILTPDTFRAKEFDADKINILLTFDDGYQSWIDVCLPILRKFGLKALFFINSGLLDITGDKEKVEEYMSSKLLITPKKPLTWEMARVLVEEGHSIGGHTVTHFRLSKLSDPEVRSELEIDKKRIEEILGIVTNDFAYPFGTKHDYSIKTIRACSEVGYTSQYSAVSSFVVNKRLPILPRTLIENGQSLFSIRMWMLGAYDFFHMMKKSK